MKQIYLCFCCMALSLLVRSQNNVGIGTASPAPSAILDISSTTKGLLAPRMTTTQRNAIAAPAKGLLVYDTDVNSLYHYNGSAWANLDGGSSTGVFANTNGIVHNTGNHATDNFIFGRESLLANNETGNGNMFFFIKEKGAFHAGGAGATSWRPDSIGLYSFSAGALNKTKGEASIALGRGNYVTGDFSFGAGQSNLITYQHSAAIGFSNTVNASNSYVFGSNNQIIGSFRSFVSGFNNKITAGSGAIFGRDNSILDNVAYSFVVGENCRGVGNYLTAIGEGIVSRSRALFAVGRWNDSIAGSATQAVVPTDPIFIIGNGTADNARSNAITVLKNGNVGIGATDPGYLLDLNGRMRIRHNGNTAGIFYNKSDNSTGIFAGMKTNTQWGVFGNSWQFYFDVSDGQAYKSSGSTAWIIASDERLKENIHPYTDGLQQVLDINPVWFNYKKESGYESTRPYVGVLAQEVKETAPYMIGEFEKDGEKMLNLDNTAMTYMLINAIKEQQAQIEDLKKELAALKKK